MTRNSPAVSRAGHEWLSRSAAGRIAILFLLAVTFGCYANSFSNGFVSDDFYVIKTSRDAFDLQGVKRALTSPDNLVNVQTTPYYRPLNRLSYVAERQLFGLNPAGYHLVSISLHALVVILIYRLLVACGCGILASVAAASLFALHPVNAEPVNFISGRNNILATAFVVGSYLSFLQGEVSRGKRWYILSGLLFFLGLLAKETAAMLLVLLVWRKTLRNIRRLPLRELLRLDMEYILPHVVLLAIYLALRKVALDAPVHLAGIGERLLTTLQIVPKYAATILLPTNLSFHYVVPPKTMAAAPLVGWGALLVAAWLLTQFGNDTIRFGLAWTLLNFLPISNIVPIPSAPMADRYLYLPLVGVALILGGLLQDIASRKRLIACGAILVGSALAAVTFHRNRDWRDNLAVDAAIVRSSPSWALGHCDLGIDYLLRGEREHARLQLTEALAPGTPGNTAATARYYLAALELERHDPTAAERLLVQAQESRTGVAGVYYLLGTVRLGDRDPEAAKEAYNKFLMAAGADSAHLIPEAGSVVDAGVSPPAMAALQEHRQLPPSLRSYGRLTSGTELLYDPRSIRRSRGAAAVSATYLLSKSDRNRYALAFIKYPLTAAAEADFGFEMNCGERLYRMTGVRFADGDRKILADLDVEKEDYLFYHYVPAGTPTAVLYDQVCTDDKAK